MLVRYRGISSVTSSLIQFELFFPIIESETSIKTERNTWTFSAMLIYTISSALWKFLYWNFYSEKKGEKLVFTAFHTQGHSWVHITCLCSSQIQTHTRSSLAVAQWDEINKVLASPAGYFLCNFMWFIYLFSSSLRGS